MKLSLIFTMRDLQACSKKKVGHRDTAKNEKSQIFVLFENEASYEDFLLASVSSHVTDTLCNIFNQNLI